MSSSGRKTQFLYRASLVCIFIVGIVDSVPLESGSRSPTNKQKSYKDAPSLEILSGGKNGVATFSIDTFDGKAQATGAMAGVNPESKAAKDVYRGSRDNSEDVTLHRIPQGLSPMDTHGDNRAVQGSEWLHTPDQRAATLRESASFSNREEEDGDCDKTVYRSTDVFTDRTRKTCNNEMFMEKTPSIRGEEFDCSPCTCTTDSNGQIEADCAQRGLQNIPEALPSNVYSINMKHNALTEFNTSKILMYPGLVQIDLSRNEIKHVFGTWLEQSGIVHSSLGKLNFDSNLISNISCGAFSPFINLKTLRFSSNKLTRIRSGTFNGLGKLNTLYVSRNTLKFFDDDVFEPISALRELHLEYNNRLTYSYKHMNPVVFRSMKALKKFHIHGCNGGVMFYPNYVLDELTELEELSVDGIDSQLFSSPKLSLRSLKFKTVQNAHCHFKNLTQKLFKNIPNLLQLSVEYCHFHNIDRDTFIYNTNLQHLKFQSIVTYDLEKAFEDLELLRNSPLKSIKFIHLYISVICRTLSKQHGERIKQFELEELDLSDNRIALLDGEFLFSLPRTLKRLLLSKNRFDLKGNLWNRIPFLTNLTELDMSNQNIDWRSYYDDSSVHNARYRDRGLNVPRPSGSSPWRFHAGQNGVKPTRQNSRHLPSVGGRVEMTHVPGQDANSMPESNSLRKCAAFDLGSDFSIGSNHNMKWRLPPNLKTVKASMYIGFGELLLYSRDVGENNLKNLFFSNAFMTKWGSGRLPASVTYADLSRNHCNVLLTIFFPANNSLIHLNMQKNYLGVPFAEDTDGILFSNLGKLLHLEISSNNIFELSGNFLKGLRQLTTLNLSENKLRVLNLKLSHLKLLSSIDFSRNAIYRISETTLRDLDTIGSHHHLSVNFRDNSFPCTCEGLPIFKWMTETKVVLEQTSKLTCINSKGKVEKLGDISLRYAALQRSCTARATYKYIISSAVILVVVFIVAASVYRNRWKLRYMKNCTLTKWLGFRPKGATSSEFKFDAYILYAEDDRPFVLTDMVRELQEARGHKLCIEDRDFIPGTFNTNNMICAIQNSTVTVLVVSPSSLASGDVEYAIQMAVMEEFYSQARRPVLYLLIYKHTGERTLPLDLQRVLRNDRFLQHPLTDNDNVSDDVMQGFWNTMSDAIGHTSNPEVRPELSPEIL